MPQVKKSREKVTRENLKKRIKENLKSKSSKNKISKTSTSSKTKTTTKQVQKTKTNSRSERKKADNPESSIEETIECSPRKKLATKNCLSPRKDPKLRKAIVVLKSFNIKEELYSQNLLLHNSVNSGISSETSFDLPKNEAKLEVVKSEPSTSLSNINEHSADNSLSSKNKSSETSTSSKTRVQKTNPHSRRKKADSPESSDEERIECSPKKKLATKNCLSPRKDPKLGKAIVVLKSLNVKEEPDSENLLLHNSVDSGISSETSFDLPKNEAKLEDIKSEPSTSLSYINERSKDNSLSSKNKSSETSKSSKTRVQKTKSNSHSKRKKADSAESSDEERIECLLKNKLATKNCLFSRKDPKLGNAKVVLKSLSVKEETVSENLVLRNSVDSGISSEASTDLPKNEAKLEVVKSEPSTSLSNINEQSADNSSSSESEWEEVEENCEASLDDYKPDIPKEGVEITIDCPDLLIRKHKKKKIDQNECIRLHINRVRKDIQLSVHKTHLLCLLAHGIHVNKVLNSDIIKSFALSLVPDQIFSFTAKKKVDKVDINGIEKVVSWFRDSFTFENEKRVFLNIFTSLVKSFQNRKSMNASEYNLMFIVFARLLGFKVRFCVSLYPITYKASNLLKKPKSKKDEKSELVEDKEENEPVPSKKSKKDVKSELVEKREDNASACNKKRQKAKLQKAVKSSNTSKKKQGNLSESKEKHGKTSRPRRSKKKNYKASSDEDDDDDDIDDEDFKINDDDIDDEEDDIDDEDDDIDDEDFKMNDDDIDAEDFEMNDDSNSSNKRNSKKQNRSRNRNSNRKVLSSDSEPPSPEQSILESGSIVCWAEIYSKPDKQWISIECSNSIVNKPYHIEMLAPQPVLYILAFDNESFVKDVTRRYCNEYMTATVKLRVDPEWWEKSLEPFLPPNSVQNKAEERKLDELMVNKPLPTTVQEFKNHPLYALKRHLLKFEAIYPPNAPAVGFLRGEPIYARDCVHQLRSRKKWLKEARVVRIGEEPYKIVKATPIWDKVARAIKTDLPPMEIFGHWQTEQYEPPIAVDGKIPRNEYGNVELFKPGLLPRGTVHLQLPGLNRIAKKLGIDCSPAVVGFDGHKARKFRPVFDGFVICEEYKDAILAAWDEEQENAKKRKEEKRNKRIYGNWKKLIKGLLIRERIKLKYHTKE